MAQGGVSSGQTKKWVFGEGREGNKMGCEGEEGREGKGRKGDEEMEAFAEEGFRKVLVSGKLICHENLFTDSGISLKIGFGNEKVLQ